MKRRKDPPYIVELDLRLTRMEERMEWTVHTLRKLEGRIWALLAGVVLSIVSAVVMGVLG